MRLEAQHYVPVAREQQGGNGTRERCRISTFVDPATPAQG
jgi:hypothetical protein